MLENRPAWQNGLEKNIAGVIARSYGTDPILSTQSIPRGRDRILSTHRSPRGRDPILPTQI